MQPPQIPHEAAKAPEIKSGACVQRVCAVRDLQCYGWLGSCVSICT
jgi:hypothetical protein